MTTIPVTVVINSDELRTWANKHADAGNHGVAHVLYQAAKGAESLSEQAIREAKAEALREAADAFSKELGTNAANPAPKYIAGWLHNRAAKLEGK